MSGQSEARAHARQTWARQSPLGRGATERESPAGALWAADPAAGRDEPEPAATGGSTTDCYGCVEWYDYDRPAGLRRADAR